MDFPSQSEPMIHRWQEDAQLQAFLDKLDDLVDAVSRVEPQMLYRLETLDKKVTALQKDVRERCVPQFSDHHLSSNPAPVIPGPAPRPDNAGSQMMSPTVLQDASSRTNIISPVVGGFQIAGDVVNLALQICHSRRNLAAMRFTHCIRGPAATVVGSRERQLWMEKNSKLSSLLACSTFCCYASRRN